MYAPWRHGLLLLSLLGSAAVSGPAQAWVETSVQADTVDLELDRQGQATVRHELLLRVRGGPLRSFELPGVDNDAKPLAEATVVASAGGSSAEPLPLIVQRRDDGTLALEIDHARGLRRGSYLFRFGYRTDLLGRELIRVHGGRAEVRWIGPRFPQGIESAKVVFRLPKAPEPPALPSFDPASLGPDAMTGLGGTFLGSLRRAGDRDEFEVTRPYVAQGEPVVWRVLADARAFPDLVPSEPPTATAPTGLGATLGRPLSPWTFAAAGAIALAYALLVWSKWQRHVAACERRHLLPRPLLPLPPALRGALSGALLVAAGATSLLADASTLAGLLLVASLLLATIAPPRLLAPLRGPGDWRQLRSEALRARPAPSLPGRWLDAGSLPGFALFAALLGLLGIGSASLVASSPYEALLVALGASCLVPVFCTGCPSRLPGDPLAEAHRRLGRLRSRLQRHRELTTGYIGRSPRGGGELDEVRLLVVPRSPLPGLGGLEIALEVQAGLGGAVTEPAVLLRALDGSAAHQRLAGVVHWTRGRSAEERVAVLRPKLPTAAMTLSLVARLARALTDERRRDLRWRAAPPAIAPRAARTTTAHAKRRPPQRPRPTAPVCPDGIRACRV